jgi:hypothetical protein
LDVSILPTCCYFSGQAGRDIAGISVRNEKREGETSGRKGVPVKGKRFLKTLLGVVLVLALGTIMLFPTGCSRMLPTAPEDAVQGYSAEDLWPGPPANLVPWPRTCSGEASGLCRPDKEVKLKVKNDCFEVSFDVASGGVQEEVLISMEVMQFNYMSDEGELEKGLFFNFGPDGLVFSKDARVEFRAEVIGAEDGEVVRLFWLNPKTGLWEVEQEVMVENEMVELEFYVSHFSRYAIS